MAKASAALAGGTMKKPRLGTNDWATDNRGDERGFFDSWVLVMRGRTARHQHGVLR
jgi:hypothetical protein